MTQQQLELQRFLKWMASEIAYRHAIMPYEVEVLRTLERYIHYQYFKASQSNTLLYLRLALDTAAAQLDRKSQNTFVAIEVALRIAEVVGELQQLFSPTTEEEQQ